MHHTFRQSYFSELKHYIKIDRKIKYNDLLKSSY